MRSRGEPGGTGRQLIMPSIPQPKSLQSGFIAGGVIVMIAVSGYFVGLRQTNSAISITRPVEVVKEETSRDLTGAEAVPLAVRYIDQNWSVHGPNGLWRTSLLDFEQLPAPPPDTRHRISPVEKTAALNARTGRRACDGAPPVVPHPIAQDSSASCLACHGKGLQVKDRFASKISHPVYGGSCTQCHVSSYPAFTAADQAQFAAPLAENSFRGLEAPSGGPRAWEGAPPGIPHRTFMRQDCMSCHGPAGQFALRTPHPDRQSCLQCHLPSAALDQLRFINNPPLGDLPLPADLTRPPAPRPEPAGPLPPPTNPCVQQFPDADS